MSLPSLTAGQLHALKIAARHTPRTPRSERVERHPLGKQYVAELAAKGLLAKAWFTSPRARAAGWEVTVLAVEVLRAHWLGELRTEPYQKERDEQADQGADRGASAGQPRGTGAGVREASEYAGDLGGAA